MELARTRRQVPGDLCALMLFENFPAPKPYVFQQINLERMKTNHSLRFIKCAGILALLTTTAVSWSQTLGNGLIFYAPFAASLNDTAGGLTATALNSPTLQASGGVGGGGYLQLQNDSVSPEQTVYYNDPTPASNSFSFQVWVRTADFSSAQNGQTWPDMPIAATKDWDSGANVGWVIARQDGADGDKFPMEHEHSRWHSEGSRFADHRNDRIRRELAPDSDHL